MDKKNNFLCEFSLRISSIDCKMGLIAIEGDLGWKQNYHEWGFIPIISEPGELDVFDMTQLTLWIASINIYWEFSIL